MERKDTYMESFLIGKLPKSFAESEASIFAKKVMGALLFHAETYKKVRETGVVVCSNEQLRKVASIGKEYLLPAIKELESYGLIERNTGRTWKQGEKKQASEYKINVEALLEPLKKKELENDCFLEKFSFLRTPSEPSADGESPTYTNSNTKTNTNSYSDSFSKTNSDSFSKTNSDSDSSSKTNSDSDSSSKTNSDSSSNLYLEKKPNGLKTYSDEELMDFDEEDFVKFYTLSKEDKDRFFSESVVCRYNNIFLTNPNLIIKYIQNQ